MNSKKNKHTNRTKKAIILNEKFNLQKEFDALYQSSKENKEFYNLMELVISDNNIRRAFKSLSENKGSMTSGVDGYNIKDIGKLSEEKIFNIIRKKLKNYKPSNIKRVNIAKDNGKTRPLGIPTIMDRLIQQCFNQILEPICEAKFNSHSYGFRPNCNAENALADVYKNINLGKNYYVISVDIKSYFDNINHNKLIKQLWSFGIRDKTILSIIKAMVKAKVELPNKEIIDNNTGVPQGGIISPLLANVYLNELDWWISSQWNDFEAKNYKTYKNPNGSQNKSNLYKVLRESSNMKEMYIVRYADDFKIFCKTHKDATNTRLAVEKWLKERLKLEVSPEKTNIVDVREKYIDFLGFQIKAIKKRNKFVVKSKVGKKSLMRTKAKADKYIKNIKISHWSGKNAELDAINKFNLFVVGYQNYFQYATDISIDSNKLGYSINNKLKLRCKAKRKGDINKIKFIAEKYKNCKDIYYVNNIPLAPIRYVKCKNPMFKSNKENKYTIEGRKNMNIKVNSDYDILKVILNQEVKKGAYAKDKYTMEYRCNRIAKWYNQKGKCNVMNYNLTELEIACHHIKPLKDGGTDEYKNLVILHKDIHKLIHSTNSETIKCLLSKLKPNMEQLKKINKYRKILGNMPI